MIEVKESIWLHLYRQIFDSWKSLPTPSTRHMAKYRKFLTSANALSTRYDYLCRRVQGTETSVS